MKLSLALCSSILIDGLYPQPSRVAVISGSISKVMRLLLGSREPRFCLLTQDLLRNRDSF
jgi:hypothetical protein